MKILLLVHESLVPPSKVDFKTLDKVHTPWVTEYNVLVALESLKHNVEVLGLYEDLSILRKKIDEFKPKVVFNLLEEFKGEAIFDQNVVSYLELLGVPYTGCNPKGLILARDKALSKKIMSYHKIRTPKFQVFPRNQPHRKIRLKNFPLIVKCLNEEASLGLSQASIVNSEEKLKERVQFIFENFNTDVIAEEFIEGREFFVGVMGNYRTKALPVWQLNFDQSQNPQKEFYSTKAKFNKKYRNKKGISTAKASISKDLELKLQKQAIKVYKALGLNAYARIDLRVDKDENIYVLEVNPNPDISEMDDFASSAKYGKISYKKLIERIILLARQWNPIENIAYPASHIDTEDNKQSS